VVYGAVCVLNIRTRGMQRQGIMQNKPTPTTQQGMCPTSRWQIGGEWEMSRAKSNLTLVPH